jgi:hypothetical protein
MLLFLDIDGVLVPAKSWKNPELLTDGFPAFDVKAVQILQKLISEDTTVMLTTSHKSRFSVVQWKGIFQKRGLKVNQLKTLEDNVNYLSRKDEVLNWFNLNSINEDFIIIDDDKSLNGLPAFLKERLILTSPLIGLTEEHWHEIKIVLAKKQKVS